MLDYKIVAQLNHVINWQDTQILDESDIIVHHIKKKIIFGSIGSVKLKQAAKFKKQWPNMKGTLTHKVKHILYVMQLSKVKTLQLWLSKIYIQRINKTIRTLSILFQL